MEFKKLKIPKTKKITRSGVLVEMPETSKYKGYCFWHNIDLVKKNKETKDVYFYYTDAFDFVLVKYNYKTIISQVIIDAATLEQEFEERK